MQRAFANTMHAFPFFAAAVLVAHAAGRHSRLTLSGMQLYVWARVAYVLLYAAGVPIARTLAFLAGLAGIVTIVMALT